MTTQVCCFVHIVTSPPLLPVARARHGPTPQEARRHGAQGRGPWGSASGAESRAEREPGGSVESGQHRVWPCGPTASPTPHGDTLGRGDSPQRELPSVKQAEGQDAHPISALLVGPGVLRRLQAAPVPHLGIGVPPALPAASPHPWGCSLFLQGALTVSFPVGDHQGPEPPKS